MKCVSKNKVIILILLLMIWCIFLTNKNESIDYDKATDNVILISSKTASSKNIIDKELERQKMIVYNNMTMDELVAKLNRSLNSDISNKGDIIAKYSLQYGVDPYIATAIILHETGCKWECSYLVKACNNVGGIKGPNACYGAYNGYSSLDHGIIQFITNLSENYYKVGLNTVELINTKYTGSTTWSNSVHNYIREIESK